MIGFRKLKNNTGKHMTIKSQENYKKVEKYLKKYSGKKSTSECCEDLGLGRTTVWKYTKLINEELKKTD